VCDKSAIAGQHLSNWHYFLFHTGAEDRRDGAVGWEYLDRDSRFLVHKICATNKSIRSSNTELFWYVD
jgi:hypothetical protein